jgi:hypothetical protein
MRKTCGTAHHYACACREALFTATTEERDRLSAENERLRGSLQRVSNRARARGYPTGGEWNEMIVWVNQALATEETK